MTTVELQCWGPCLHHWQGCIPCKADKSRRILWCKASSHAWNSGQNHPTCHIRCSTFCINVLHQRCHDHDETRWYHGLRESPWSKSRQHPAEQAGPFQNSWCVWCEKRKHDILSFCLLLLLTSDWKGIAFCSVSVNFQIQILCFLDSLIVRWQLGRVRGSQFLANLSSPQLTLHGSHENEHPAFHC